MWRRYMYKILLVTRNKIIKVRFRLNKSIILVILHRKIVILFKWFREDLGQILKIKFQNKENDRRLHRRGWIRKQQMPFLIKEKVNVGGFKSNFKLTLFRFPTPHCRWFQRDTYIFLTVEIMDCQEPDISVMDNKLVFTCTGDEMKKYELDIELLQSISTKVGDWISG